MKIVSAASISEPFIKDLKTQISALASSPKLVGFLANDDPAAVKYAEWTAKTCKDTGIDFELRKVPRTELEDQLTLANADSNVHGIMIYYPVFGGSQDQYLQNTVSVTKDVEGLSHTYRYNLYHNVRYLDSDQKIKCLLPCTPLGIIKILEAIGAYNLLLPLGDRLHGRIITVINRSEVVGRPLAALLANDGAKVYSIDEFGVLEFHRGEGIKMKKHEIFETSITLKDALSQSDIVIGGVPSKSFKIPTNQLKEGVIAVNFSSFKNFEDDITEKASLYVPSVGKVTVAMLERNLIRLYEYHQLRKNF
jgi:methylenetetrahydrofolate dehydrogenase (NAD+)